MLAISEQTLKRTSPLGVSAMVELLSAQLGQSPGWRPKSELCCPAWRHGLPSELKTQADPLRIFECPEAERRYGWKEREELPLRARAGLRTSLQIRSTLRQRSRFSFQTCGPCLPTPCFSRSSRAYYLRKLIWQPSVNRLSCISTSRPEYLAGRSMPLRAQ